MEMFVEIQTSKENLTGAQDEEWAAEIPYLLRQHTAMNQTCLGIHMTGSSARVSDRNKKCVIQKVILLMQSQMTCSYSILCARKVDLISGKPRHLAEGISNQNVGGPLELSFLFRLKYTKSDTKWRGNRQAKEPQNSNIWETGNLQI